jgi:hypothetical protein
MLNIRPQGRPSTVTYLQQVHVVHFTSASMMTTNQLKTAGEPAPQTVQSIGLPQKANSIQHNASIKPVSHK